MLSYADWGGWTTCVRFGRFVPCHQDVELGPVLAGEDGLGRPRQGRGEVERNRDKIQGTSRICQR